MLTLLILDQLFIRYASHKSSVTEYVEAAFADVHLAPVLTNPVLTIVRRVLQSMLVHCAFKTMFC
jgi:hypothetical protein